MSLGGHAATRVLKAAACCAKSLNMSTRFSVFIALSLDGYIARSDGALDWLACVERPNEDYGYAEFMDSIDTLVVGRSTYQTVLGFGDWPYQGKDCIVLSHAPQTSLHGERFWTGDVAQLASAITATGKRRVYVDGGKVIQQFLAADLIDDLTLSVIPLLLGTGIRLFSEAGPERALELGSSSAFGSGLVQLRYRRPRSGRAGC